MPATSPLVRELRRVLSDKDVITSPSELIVYDCDGYTIVRNRPLAVVFPRSVEQVSAIVRLCNKFDVPFVARGAGTGLAGGCTPPPCGVVISLARMNKILQISPEDHLAVVEPGVLNTQLAKRLKSAGLQFAPDPASQTASTIGGNVGTGAGGPHTLKYGTTVNHVLGLQFVDGTGEIYQIGPVSQPGTPDLVGLLVGSEGTLGIVTRIWVRLVPFPAAVCTLRAAFAKAEQAGQAVSDMIAAGVIPAALELMDRGIIEAVEEAFGFGFPLDAEAVLIIELDGLAETVAAQQEKVEAICRQNGATEILSAADEKERAELWKCRKSAVGAAGRLSPNYCIHDGVVPRSKLPQIIRRIQQIAGKYRLRIVNVAHAGDGNIHPLFLFDQHDEDQVTRVRRAAVELLNACLELGGSISAEHGVGVEKLELMPRQFSPADLTAMQRVRDSFNPKGLLGKGKLLPENGFEPAVLQSVEKPMDIKASRPALQGDPHSQFEEAIDAHGVDDICRAVKAALQQQRAVYPAGCGSLLHYGGAPSKPGLLLRLRQMKDLVELAAEDLTVTAQAGMTLAELNNLLAENNQCLPVCVPLPEQVTLGGMVNLNLANTCTAYGNAADWLLAFRAVDGTANYFGGGARVVKNAAGYNMPRLMVGSLGQFAILTELTFRTFPRPEKATLLAATLPTFTDLDGLQKHLASHRFEPTGMMVLFGPQWLELIGASCTPASDACATAVFFVEGSQSEVDKAVEELSQILELLPCSYPTELVCDRTARTAWQRLVDRPWQLARENAGCYLLELRCLRHSTARHASRLADTLPECTIVAFPLAGLVLAVVPRDLAQDLRKLKNALHTTCPDYDRACCALHALSGASQLAADQAFEPAGKSANLLMQLKRRFDPHGILNPGRVSYIA